jgi:precorrin-3B synthase
MEYAEGLCPGVLHPAMAKDGILVRIRTPGGILPCKTFGLLGLLAQQFAGGYIEITARANLQLRGIRSEHVEELADALEKCGLLRSRLHDRVRNILASPFAGIDPQELIDTRPIVRELDECLQRDEELAKLPPKFAFAIDGAGYAFDQGGTDLALRAERSATGLQFRLFLGVRPLNIGPVPGQESELLLKAARACLDIAGPLQIPARGRSILTHPLALEHFHQRLNGYALSQRDLEQDKPKKPAASPIPFGVVPTRNTEMVALIPSVPLGRLTTEKMLVISDLCQSHGASVRLAPWRGIILSPIPASSAAQLSMELQNIGLSLDSRDGFRGLAACAGIEGCASAHVDVRADAIALAGLLTGVPRSPAWKINLAGCEKRCGMRTNAMMDLIGTAAGYSVHLQGQPMHANCPPAKAISLAASFRETTTGLSN